MPNTEVHISSLVVHVMPQHLARIKAHIEAIDEVEIYGDSPEGKIVVVLETSTHGFITDIIDQINQLDAVISTVMVYHQIETELDDENENTMDHSVVEGDV